LLINFLPKETLFINIIFFDIEFKFSADYNKLEYVYVVKNLFKVEQDLLENSIADE
jgi:hypothetical protein